MGSNIKLKHYLFRFMIYATIMTYFGCGSYLIYPKHFKNPYPLSYTYNVPIEKVREKTMLFFRNTKFKKISFEIGYNTFELTAMKIMKNENRNHFFINNLSWNSTGRSKLYYTWWGKLKLYPSYHIILDSLSESKTKITIKSYPEVKIGIYIFQNHLIPNIAPKKVRVEPSSIEEYDILRNIGILLEEKNMPPSSFEQK